MSLTYAILLYYKSNVFKYKRDFANKTEAANCNAR